MKYDSTKVRGVVELSFGFYTKPRFLYTYTECFGMSFRRREESLFFVSHRLLRFLNFIVHEILAP